MGIVPQTTVTVRDVKGNQGRQECHLQLGASRVCLAARDANVVTGNRNVRGGISNQERQEFHCQPGTSGVSLANRNVRGLTGNQGRQGRPGSQ